MRFAALICCVLALACKPAIAEPPSLKGIACLSAPTNKPAKLQGTTDI